MREISDLVTVSTCFDCVTVSRVLSPLPLTIGESQREKARYLAGTADTLDTLDSDCDQFTRNRNVNYKAH